MDDAYNNEHMPKTDAIKTKWYIANFYQSPEQIKTLPVGIFS